MILTRYLPLNLVQEITLIIVILAIVLWITEWIPIFVTSFLILFLELVWLLPNLKPYHPGIGAEFFLAPFFSDTVVLFLGGFVISSAFHKYSLDEKFAQLILRKNSTSSIRLVFSLVFATSFLSLWMNNTATTSLMMGISLPILNGYPKGSGWRKVILLCIPFASNIGGMGTPVGTLPNALAVEYLRNLGSDPSFLEWMIFSIPLILILNSIMPILLILIFCKKEIYYPIPIFTFTDNQEEESPGYRYQKFLIIGSITFITILGWLTSGWHGLSNGTVALIPVIGFFGFRVLGIQEFRNLSWEVLILMGGGIALGKAIEISGLARLAIGFYETGGESIFIIALVFSLITITLSSIMSNTATANLMIPLALGLSTMDVPLVVVMVALSASIAMPLPVSTPPNAIAFGYGELKTKDMSIPGLAITLIGLILVASLGYWLIKILVLG
ncbi:MAG: SLC13/DASS family transporter [Leptospira sp.]|nr:SLC13/DASS family transporter [Leptospira sp.]